MSELRTIHIDWYNGSVKTTGGPQLAYQYDHLSNLVIFDNAPRLENYYLIVEMKETEDGPVRTLEPIQLAGSFWLIPNSYTQLAQNISYQICCKTPSGDFERHSAQFVGVILPSKNHDGVALDVDPSIMYDPYRQWVQDIAMGAGAIVVDPTLSVQGAAADAKAVGDAVAELNGRLEQLVGVPATVRAAINTVLQNVVFDDDTAYGNALAVIATWASTDCTGITLSANTLSFTSATTQRLTATLSPVDCEETVYWASSNTNVATVSNGTVTPVGDGSCTITASCGNISASCSVTVSGVSVTYPVNATLMNLTSTGASTATGSYSATLSDTPTYIVVTMGGTDITSSAVNGANISIGNVSGDVNIFAYKKTTETVSGYTFYDYVKSTAANAYIDTGDSYTPSFGILDYELVFKDSVVAGNQPIMGARTVSSNDGNYSQYAVYDSSNNEYINMTFNGEYTNDIETVPIVSNGMNSVRYEYSDSDSVNSLIRVNGVDHEQPSTASSNLDTSNTASLYLFAANNNGTVAGSSYYGLQIGEIRFWDGSTLVHDYVPAKENSTSHYGVYDLVDETFHPMHTKNNPSGYSGTAGDW